MNKSNHYIKLNYKIHTFHIKHLENTDIFIPSLKITNKDNININENPELSEYIFDFINNEIYFYKQLLIFKSPINSNIILEFMFNPTLIEDTNEIIFKIIEYILNNNIGKYINTSFSSLLECNWICTFELIDKELSLQLI